ncbi:major facilitator superfamily domain-containing protein [Dipodascopsis uninucleata]
MIPKRSTSYIVLLTLVIGGLQLSWSTEFSNGTPFLLSLGMSKTIMSLVWIAGPLSGVLIQPIVGMLSDSSLIEYGKRRPFMIGGTVATTASLMILSWSKYIVGTFHGSIVITQFIAVIMVYILDFSIGTVQASSRALIVDCVSIHQQQAANAWAAVMTGFGNIIGFVLGSLDLPIIFPIFGDTQFKVLCAFASIALIGTVAIACNKIKEKPPVILVTSDSEIRRRTINQFFKRTILGITRLSPQTRLICDAEFCAWLGYFPMLFYSTTYVGEVHYREMVRSRGAEGVPLSQEEIDYLWEDATRYASLSLLLYSIVSLASNLFLPLIIAPSYTTGEMTKVSKLRIDWLTLPRSWMLSHIVFAVAMMSTFFIHTGWQATLMIGVLGIPWAHALWAPFALIAEEISRIQLHDRLKNKYEYEAGIVMGVHNVFVSAPQVLSSLASSVLFKLLAKQRGEEGDNSIAWSFRISAIGALLAAYLCMKIKTPEMLEIEEEIEEDEESSPSVESSVIGVREISSDV